MTEMILTDAQQVVLDEFLEAVEQKNILCKDSSPRRIGKTRILNELAFILQSLGYFVYFIVPDEMCRYREYFACGFISVNSNSYRGIPSNSVIIGDEAQISKIEDIINYCKSHNIPMIGYFNL